MSRIQINKINILDIFNQDNFSNKFVNKIDTILAEYSREEFINTTTLCDDVKLEALKLKLSKIVCEACDIHEENLIIKNRRGLRYKESTSNDIYTLSHFYLDNNFSEEINEIYTIGKKPFEYLKEKQQTKNLIDQLYASIPHQNPSPTSSTMEESLKQIIVSMGNLNDQMKSMIDNQNKMQSQLNKNSNDICEIKKDMINLSKNEISMRNEEGMNKRKKPDYDKGNNSFETVLNSTSNQVNEITYQQENDADTRNGKKPKIKFSTMVQKDLNEGTQFKKKIVVGNSKNVSLNAAKRVFDVFINNVASDENTNNVGKMFSDNNIPIICCEEFPKRLNRSKAFVVRIPYEHKDLVYKENLWPSGICLSKFNLYKKNEKTKNNEIKSKTTRLE